MPNINLIYYLLAGGIFGALALKTGIPAAPLAGALIGASILSISDKVDIAEWPIGTRTILEIGIGSNNISIPSNMGEKGFPGASLKVFSEIYPHSEIFGADIDKQILKNFKNVKMYYLDQNDLKTYNNDIINEKYFDLIIDDGLHMQSANLNTLIFALERLKPGGVLVIEDITISALNTWHITDGLLKDPYKLSLYKCFDNYAVTVELKK